MFKRTPDESPHTNDTIAEIQQRLASGEAVMLDVRGQEERDAGHLANSIFIPITEIKALEPGTTSVENLPADKIVYCH